MKKFKILRNVFIALTLLLTHWTCIVVASNYANMLCMIEHGGFSSPADTAFILAIPYCIGIIVCTIFALIFHGKICERRHDK